MVGRGRLADPLRNKTLQLQAILLSAETMFDATRDVKLFEVFTYKTNCINGAESTTRASRTLEAEQTNTGNKKPRVPKEMIVASDGQEDPDEPKEFTETQRKQIAHTLELVKKNRTRNRCTHRVRP